MRIILNNKKGDVTDIILLLVILFFLAVSMVVALFANSKIKNIIDTTVLNESAAYSSITYSFATVNELTVQRGFIIFFGILVIGILVSSFLIKVHPVFIFLYIITLSAAIFVSVYLANSYELIVSNPQFAAIAANYTMITWVMQHVVKILVAVGAMSMIIIFGKIFGGSPAEVQDI
jgi:hypothetical protein